MYPRLLAKELKIQAHHYPVVTVLGPRQSGKTTLVTHTFPDKVYVNLEAPDVRELFKADPKSFLQNYREGAIFDEVQRLPELLSYIQLIVDESERKGQFILTGSHQLELHQASSQSLAGRTALLTLLPLSMQEISDAGIEMSLDQLLFMGGYPRIFKDHLDPVKAYRNYFQTYVERDLRQLILVKDLAQFQKFIKLCAGRIGQILNLESLSNDVGVSSHTIKHWISILEASFIVVRLHPYYENFGKRVIKSPKLYFTDVGLASYFLGIENITQLARDPLRGNLFENLIVMELIKARVNQGLDPNLYYFRDTHGHEVDLIFQSGRELIPIEVKSTATFQKDLLKNLEFFKKISDRTTTEYLVYSGDHGLKVQDVNLIFYKRVAEIVRQENQP